CFELITKPAQSSKSLFNVKKSRLLHFPYPNQLTGNGITELLSKPEGFSNPPGANIRKLEKRRRNRASVP
ncbi:hypothetical protein, partial [Gluconobacter kondonii]|uniref:hypothetical protein n=1 Tax=Gluconobacter kondonii TaxID=941463 RepID=UPI001B8C5D4A